MKRILTSGILAALAVVAVPGQGVTDRPTFEAVSIRPSPADARGGGYNISSGRLNGKNAGLKELVKFAYDLHDYQLSGATGWMDTDHYEILATFPGDTTNTKRAQMMQAMLADRFGLAIHKEGKEITGYSLVVGKNGAKLHAPDASQHEGMMLGRSRTSGQRTLTANSATMAGLAAILADLLGRPVEDKTALAGVFDFNMEWTPDSSEGIQKAGVEKQDAPGDGQTGPSIFTALQETLGLKLETRKVTVQAIVIDKAEKPSAN